MPGTASDRLAAARRLAPRLRWPLPALLGWALGWAAFAVLRGGPWSEGVALAVSAGVPLGLLGMVSGRTRRWIVGAGFPLSALALGVAGGLPGWTWLLPLAALLLLYPWRAWSDAPLYPTAPDALDGLRVRLALPAQARLLDAGCGLGHGLQALRREWPLARLSGIERSAPLAWIARRRVPGAAVRWGDMWAASWAGHDLVYLFQRPESMAQAWAKAQAELEPGAWLVSLEFEVPGREPELLLRAPGRRPVRAYRVGARPLGREGPADLPIPAQPRRPRADKRR